MHRKSVFEQSWYRITGLNARTRRSTLAAIIPGHPTGAISWRTRSIIQIGRMTHVHAPVGEIDRTFRITGKLRKKAFATAESLQVVAARRLRGGRQHILRISEHTAKRIETERVGRSFMPSKNHPAVQTTGQRHSDGLTTVKVARQIPENTSRSAGNRSQAPALTALPILSPQSTSFSASSNPARKIHEEPGGRRRIPSKRVRFSSTHPQATNSPRPRGSFCELGADGQNGLSLSGKIEGRL